MSEEIPEGIRKTQIMKLLKKSKDAKIAEMVHETSQDLSEKRIVYRLPIATTDENGKVIDYYPAFSVKAYETAIIFQLSQFVGMINEGLWEFETDYIHPTTEVVWIDKTEFKTRWGATDIYLKDGIKIGAYGSLLLKIIDPKNFVLNVVSSKKIVEREQVDKFIFDVVVQSYKEVLLEFIVEDVIKNRDMIKMKVLWKLKDFLSNWGISIENMEIEGMKLPDRYKEIEEIVITTKIKQAEHVGQRTILKEDIETLKWKTELERVKKIYEENKVLYERLGFSEFNEIMEELKSFREEMRTSIENLEDQLVNVIDEIPDKEEFLDAVYAGDKFEKYLKNNKKVYESMKKVVKKSKKTDTMIKLLVEETLEKELKYEIYLVGGAEQKGLYLVKNTFKVEISLIPKLPTFISKVISSIPVINAKYGDIEKPVLENTVELNDELKAGIEYNLTLELQRPPERTPLLIETVGKTTIHEKKYPISLITDPIEVEGGNVKWSLIKKLLKKGIKFALPTLSKRVSALLED